MDIMRTLKGFVVRRRCDCGGCMSVAIDEGEKAILKCGKCGREQKFFYNPENMLAIA